VLVNNAGITRDRSMRKLTDDDWTDVINTNLNRSTTCTSSALKPMIEAQVRAGGELSSSSGRPATSGQANYSASKGGVIASPRA